MRPCTILWPCFLAIALVSIPSVAGDAPPRPTALREETMGLLEDVERARMLLGATMRLVHDLRNFALYTGESPAALEACDGENLRLYERLKLLDYGASSLLAAVDLDDVRTAADDLTFLRTELGDAATEVLENYRAVTVRHEKARRELAGKNAALRVQSVQGRPWDDPIRERQRRLGVLLGWKSIVEPLPDYREAFWNRLQFLDLRYQLDKGRSRMPRG